MLARFIVAAALALSLLAEPALAVTTQTANICLNKPTPNDPASQNTWGTLLNTSADITDGVSSGYVSISVAGASNVVLTFNCGALDQTDNAHFNFTGILTGNINVLWPNGRGRTFSVSNNTTGSFTLSLGANNGASAPAGTVAVVPQTYTGSYYSDGTNIRSRVTSGGLTIAANSIPGNTSGSAGAGADLPVPNCSGGLTYNTGSGFGCNAGGGGGGGGTSLAWGGVQAADFTAAVNTIYCINTGSATVAMTLPASPVSGNQIVFIDCNSSFATNTFTVANNGNNLMGYNQNMSVTTNNAASTLVYTGVTLGWRMF